MKIFLVLICFISSINFAQENFEVTSVFPSSNSLTAEVNTEIRIRFNIPVDETSISDTSFFVFGRWSGVKTGNINFNDDLTLLTFSSEKSFSAGEIVFVSISKKLKDQNGNQLEKGYSWIFSIKTKEANYQLTKIDEVNVRRPGENWIQTYGTYAGDLNMDGYTDMLVPNEVANDVRIFLNDKNGNYDEFTVFEMPGGSRPSTNEGSDFNLDGLMDIAVGNSTNDKVTVFMGDGTGSFSSIDNYEADEEVRGLNILDLNGDGFMDIVTANRIGSNISIIMNNGDATFAPPNNFDANGNGETCLAMADVNNDGLMDIFAGALSSNEIILLLGDGDGNLNYHSKVSVPGAPWFICAGDVNLDGVADIVSANSSTDNFSVILCDSLGNFSQPVTYDAGNFPLAIDLGDIDGDGDLDLVTSNFSSANFVLYENDGTGNFINQQVLDAISAGSCSVFHDRDNDGDLDMTGIDELKDLLLLFENQAPTNIAEDKILPTEFILHQNYPNPFNPTTKIKYALPSPYQGEGPGVRSRFVTLKVYDILGNKVTTLVNEVKQPGIYEVEWNASEFASGVYYYRLTAGNFSETRKLILIK